MKPAFLYALHSGNLYGTERMALVTLEGLADRFEPVLFAPPGPALAEARKLGIAAEEFRGPAEFARRLLPHVRRSRRIAFAATGVMHSLVFLALNLPYRRRNLHLHLVHGGTDERESYGRKPLLNRWPITLVAVSDFVRERLIANGACPGKIVVAENFLPTRQIATAPRRPAFRRGAVRQVVVVSRVDPIKRIDLLLDALDRHPELGRLGFRVLGTGWDLDQLRARAAERHPNVAFEGFCPNVAAALADSDLLLHLCPVEPFGLAILEAMAAGLPVLVPDAGGAAGLVEPGVSGFHFRADDPDDLARVLASLAAAPARRLNAVVARADTRLRSQYSDSAGLDRYLKLLEPLCHG
jgi:glycosyltransferase involved in cell wall biosynthesis